MKQKWQTFARALESCSLLGMENKVVEFTFATDCI